MIALIFLISGFVAAPPTEAAVAVVQTTDDILGIADDIAVLCGILVALFVIDKATWKVMTGRR